MKILPALLILFPFTALTQHEGLMLSLSCSNNGQLSNVVDEFYFDNSAYGPNDDTYSYAQAALKFNFQCEYVTKEHLSIGLKGGYGTRKDDYHISNGDNAYGSKQQSYIRVAVSLKYTYDLEKLQFSTGIEVPYFAISEYAEKFLMDNPTEILHSTQRIDGGNAFGLNSTTSLKYFLTSHLFLFADATFGLLKFDMGGEHRVNVEAQDPVTFDPPSYTYQTAYKKTTLTNPELSFGIGVRI